MRGCQHLVVEQNILVLLGTSFLINSQQDLILGGLTKLNAIHQFTHPLLPPMDFFLNSVIIVDPQKVLVESIIRFCTRYSRTGKGRENSEFKHVIK